MLYDIYFICVLVWYGIMIIQTGLYDGGLFKFTLSIPINYPDGGCPVSYIFTYFVYTIYIRE